MTCSTTPATAPRAANSDQHCPACLRPAPAMLARGARPPAVAAWALQLLVLQHDARTAWACTNFMVSPGATADGAAVISYSCDGPSFAALTHYPASSGPSKRELKRRGCAEEGPSRGVITETKETYNTVGLTNEHAVAVGETTFGGVEALRGTGNLTYARAAGCRRPWPGRGAPPPRASSNGPTLCADAWHVLACGCARVACGCGCGCACAYPPCTGTMTSWSWRCRRPRRPVR